MSKLLLILIASSFIVGCTHTAVVSPIATDDYILRFSSSQGFDVPKQGQIVGHVFYLYGNGVALHYSLHYMQESQFIRRFELSASQIDQLHLEFEQSGFDTYPESFPSSPYYGPSGSTGVQYRNPTTGELKTIHAQLSQSPQGYPNGFLDLYSYLRLVFFGE